MFTTKFTYTRARDARRGAMRRVQHSGVLAPYCRPAIWLRSDGRYTFTITNVGWEMHKDHPDYKLISRF